MQLCNDASSHMRSVLQFTDGFISYPGSVSDTKIFRNSEIYKKINLNRSRYFANDEFIVGDKAYPNSSWCVAPFIRRRILTPNEERLNVMISKARNVIERSFALFFGRFRRLSYLNVNVPESIPAITIAAMVLHNVCLKNDDPFLSDYISEGERIDVNHNIDDDISESDDIDNGFDNVIDNVQVADRRPILINEIFGNNN